MYWLEIERVVCVPQTTVIPRSEELDTDVLATMNSLQCFKDKERLVTELLNAKCVFHSRASHS